jgi:hypothetical protein
MGNDPASEIDSLFKLAGTHSWMAFAAAVAWILVRVAKDDRAVKWFPVQIAPRWRAWGAAIIGLAYGILHKLAAGGSWGEAIVGGLAAGNSATLAHELVIESIRRGRDVGIPKPVDPPPPGPPPLSIKPPAGVVITESSGPPTQRLRGDVLFAWIGLAFAIAIEGGFIYAGIVLTSCKPSAPAAEAMALVGDSFECHRKGTALIALGGTCEAKQARIAELVRTDPDCIGLYADAAAPRKPCPDGAPSSTYLGPSYAEGGGGP